MVRRICCQLLYWLPILCACAVLQAQSPVAPASGLVTLHGGQVLRGQITRVGDHFLVSVGPNSQVRVPAANVEFHCETLEQAYWLKNQSIDVANVREHLELARWCIAQDLFAEAANHVVAARLLDPTSREADYVERRLRSAAGTRGASSAPPDSNHPSAGDEAADVQSWEVITRQLPTAVIERFATNVQPLLLNSCSTASCHGLQGQSQYKLLSPTWATSMTRRLTQRNLQATLSWVDKGKPLESPLLVKAIHPHGGLSAPVFDKRNQEQFGQLVRWVQELAAGGDQPSAADGLAQAQASQGDARVPGGVPLTAGPPAAAKSPRVPAPAELPASAAESTGMSPPSEPLPSAAPGEPFQPRDPFDAEIFNRRYFGPPPD